MRLSVRFFLRTQSVARAHGAGLLLYEVLRARGHVPEGAKKKVRSSPYPKISELMETTVWADVVRPYEAAELTRTHLADGWIVINEHDWMWKEDSCGPAKLLNLSWAQVELLAPEALPEQ